MKEHLLNNINNYREGIEYRNTNMVLQQTVNSSVFVYDDRGWDVPDGFIFPTSITREAGWDLWLNGNKGDCLID